MVVVGAGFGGLLAIRRLGHKPVDVTLVDRRNHHLFQPLLYQVATGMLSPGQIAPPIRHVVRRYENVRVELAEVTGFDLDRRIVHATSAAHLRDLELPYDSLIVAAGANQSYFGHDELARYAPGMKTIDDALELRRRIFGAFEMAEIVAADPAEQEKWLTDRRSSAPARPASSWPGRSASWRSAASRASTARSTRLPVRVVLLDGGKEPLATFGDRLSGKATKELERLGVELQMGARVVGVDASGVDVAMADGSHIADRRPHDDLGGGRAGLAARRQAGRGERGRARPGRTHPGAARPHAARASRGLRRRRHGRALGQAPRRRGGRHAGRPPRRQHDLATAERQADAVPFKYRDLGSVATIGRFRAIASVRKVRLSGFPGWVVWFFVHLAFLTGFGRPIDDDDALAPLDDRAGPGRAGVQHRPHRRRSQPPRIGPRDRRADAVPERAGGRPPSHRRRLARLVST